MKERINDILRQIDNDELIRINNEFCDATGYEDYIYDMWSLDEFFNGAEPSRIANMIYYGDFRPNDAYFKLDGYGNLYSFDYPEEEIDFDAIIDYMVQEQESFGNDEIEEILQGIESDD